MQNIVLVLKYKINGGFTEINYLNLAILQGTITTKKPLIRKIDKPVST